MSKPDAIAKMVRSGLRRYPRHLAASIASRGPSGAAAASTEPGDLFNEPDPLSAIWLGHATVLVRFGGRWILTDPVLTDRIGPRVAGRTVGLVRHAPPPVDPRHLPPIDLVLVSHAHFDHLDRPSLRALAQPHTTVVTAVGTAGLLPGGFGRAVELGPGESRREHGLRVTAYEPDHWGARFALDRWRGCSAYLLESDDGRVFFAGDTADTRAFDDAGPVDLSVFGVGAYDPWEHAHATPEQAWRMAMDMRSRRVLPMHHSTFEMGDEPHGEPLDRLLAAAGPDASVVLRARAGELWSPVRSAPLTGEG
jgi:L-ascorbate metabolism protein UlaG (beta-lactamase superfamily)